MAHLDRIFFIKFCGLVQISMPYAPAEFSYISATTGNNIIFLLVKLNVYKLFGLSNYVKTKLVYSYLNLSVYNHDKCQISNQHLEHTLHVLYIWSSLFTNVKKMLKRFINSCETTKMTCSAILFIKDKWVTHLHPVVSKIVDTVISQLVSEPHLAKLPWIIRGVIRSIARCQQKGSDGSSPRIHFQICTEIPNTYTQQTTIVLSWVGIDSR